MPGYLISSRSSANAATYTYDSLSRIATADYENGIIEEYSYDAAGNRLMMTVTSKWISGNGHTSSMGEIFVNIKASSLDTALFSYYDNGSGLALLSTSITGLLIDGDRAIITGRCTVNSIAEYSYIAALTDTGRDTVEIEIYGPDGAGYFSADKDILLSGDLNIKTEPPDQYQLAASLSPSGGGSLSPDCSTGCMYERGTAATITANENAGYAFINWNGCDTSANNICIMTMDNDKTVTALFALCDRPVRVAGTEHVYFSSLQDAYDTSHNNDNIYIQDAVLSENIHIDRNISTTLQGGFDCNYHNNNGRTTLEGSMIISNGTVTIEGFIIK